MNLTSVVLICVILSTTLASWLDDFVSKKRFNIGNGLVLHLQQSNDSNNQTTFYEKYSLKANYGGYGLSIGKAPKKQAVEVGIFLNEGRGKKDDYQIISMLFGFKAAAVTAGVMAMIGAIAFKALGLAKMALVGSMIMFIHKLFHKSHEEQYEYRTPEVVEVEALPEYSYQEVPLTGEDLHPSGSGNNYYLYNSYTPTAPGTKLNYQTTGAVLSNNSSTNGTQQISLTAATRRRDIGKHKQTIPFMTVHRYTLKSD